MKNSIEAGLPAKTADRRISRTLLDCTKRLFSGNEKQKRAFTAPYHFPIIFLSILPYTIWRNPLYFSAKPYTIWRNYQLLPNCIGFCQKVSLSPNCIRLSPNRLYFLAKEPQNKSSYSPECKITPKNTKK